MATNSTSRLSQSTWESPVNTIQRSVRPTSFRDVCTTCKSFVICKMRTCKGRQLSISIIRHSFVLWMWRHRDRWVKFQRCSKPTVDPHRIYPLKISKCMMVQKVGTLEREMTRKMQYWKTKEILSDREANGRACIKASSRSECPTTLDSDIYNTRFLRLLHKQSLLAADSSSTVPLKHNVLIL